MALDCGISKKSIATSWILCLALRGPSWPLSFENESLVWLIERTANDVPASERKSIIRVHLDLHRKTKRKPRTHDSLLILYLSEETANSRLLHARFENFAYVKGKGSCL